MNAKPDAEVADVVNTAIMCEQFHALPRGGGLLDQDSFTILALQAVYDAQMERKIKDNNAAKR